MQIKPTWSNDEDNLLIKFIADGMSHADIAEKLRKTTGAVRCRSYILRKRGTIKKDKLAAEIMKETMQSGIRQPKGQEEDKDNLQSIFSENDGSLTYIGREITTVDELVAHAKVDLKIWEVVEARVNQWEVAGKRRMGQGEDGKWKADELWKTPLLQIAVKLRRRAPKCIQDGLKDLLAGVPSWRGKLPAVKKIPRSSNHLLEVSCYDAHFGKLCWGEETGTDYDLKIAKDDFVGAVDDLITRTKGFAIEKIKFPIGHDFFQVDNWQKTTARGTVVDSTDDRFQKVFRGGLEAVVESAMICREVAEVEFLWVPGNHDPSTSWYLCEVLRAMFANDKRVTVDNGPKTRKYRLYGISLIGYNHGNDIDLNSLPLIMAQEVPDLWAQSVYRHYRVGHWHKKKQTRWVSTDTHTGVDVSIIPSLSGTDAWHYSKGFIGNVRQAEAALWCKETGHVGSFVVEARSAVAKRTKK